MSSFLRALIFNHLLIFWWRISLILVPISVILTTRRRWLRAKHHVWISVSGSARRSYGKRYWLGRIRWVSVQLDTLLLMPRIFKLKDYQLSVIYNIRPRNLNLTPLVTSPLSYGAPMLDVTLPHEAVLNIRPWTLNLKPLSPRALANVLSDAHTLLSRCAFVGVCTSATSTTRNISWIYCDCWIVHHTGAHINLYSAHAHRSLLKLRCFRCCGCCAAAAGSPQPVSIPWHCCWIRTLTCRITRCRYQWPWSSHQSNWTGKHRSVCCAGILESLGRVFYLRNNCRRQLIFVPSGTQFPSYLMPRDNWANRRIYFGSIWLFVAVGD